MWEPGGVSYVDVDDSYMSVDKHKNTMRSTPKICTLYFMYVTTSIFIECVLTEAKNR